MGVNSLPKTVTRQRRSCDLNQGPSVPESSTLTTRLSGVGTMGTGGYIVPPSSGLVPSVPPQVKDAAYVKI